jgi:hypothetical protein
VGIFGVQETSVKSGLITEEKESFRVGIEPTQRINIFWESKFSEGAIRGAIGRKLREDSVWFMKSEEHEETYPTMVDRPRELP